MAGKGKGKGQESRQVREIVVFPHQKRDNLGSLGKRKCYPNINFRMDNDNVNSRVSVNSIDITSPISLLPLSQPADMMSPILSQPMGSEERSKTDNIDHNTSPIYDALNLVAGAVSLRNDFAVCEKIMTEKHHFLVEMLDRMNNTVSSIENKIITLETRVKKLEENEHKQTCIVSSRLVMKDKTIWKDTKRLYSRSKGNEHEM